MVKKLVIGFLVLLVMAVAVYLLIPPGEDPAQTLDQAGAGDAKTVAPLATGADDTVLPLDASNVSVNFSCAKTLAGKVLPVHGGWSGDFDSQLSGEAIVDAAGGTVRGVTIEFEVGSLWSEHDMLTDALLNKGFFQVEKHPRARFVSTRIAAAGDGEAAMEDATHVVEGNLLLNGIEKSIVFPARIDLDGSALTVAAAFALDRKEFNVNFTDTAGFGLLTDEDISNQVALKLKVDTGKEQAVETDTAPVGVENGTTNVVDLALLEKALTETIPSTQIDFEMVLVPGDETLNIGPFYIGKREVSWDEFMPWSVCDDVKNADEHGALRARKLRPSLPYDDITRGFGTAGYPALSMSLFSARLYCEWLSEQTGETYRLPTEAEWELAYRLGGGSLDEPMTADRANEVAIFAGNSEDEITGEWMSRRVGSRPANELGLHDMAGNLCEWVVTEGDERIARGGHFESEVGDLGLGRHVEDRSWNLNYPNEPRSIWWFVDARWVGFRLVREP